MNLTEDEFDWAWAQVPDVKAIEAMEQAGYVIKPWDVCWLYAGPLYAPFDPTTLCPCRGDGGLEDRLVHLDRKLAMIDDGTQTAFRIAFGRCHGCGRIYWQADNHDAAVGFK